MLGGPFAAGSPSAAGATPTYRHTLNQVRSHEQQDGLSPTDAKARTKKPTFLSLLALAGKKGEGFQEKSSAL